MSNDYEIISLGYNCQPRTYLTQAELISTKKKGRKSMVFDLTVHSTKGVIEILKNNFADYIESMEYGYYQPFNLDYWQIKKYGVVFNHDADCRNDFEKLKTRYILRIENFKEALNSDKFIFFVHNLDENSGIDEIKFLYSVLKDIRGEKPFKLIVWDMFENFEKENIDNVEIIQLLHPYDDISDWFKSEKQYVVAKLWQKSLIDKTKAEIVNVGFNVKYFKTPLSKKFKTFIRPILKNIFTITNEPEINAKVLILLGFKFKIKKLR